MTANSGVKIAASTGARFSMTPFFASTSHAATMTAAAAPEGSTHAASWSVDCGTICSSTKDVSTKSTPPPSASSTQ